MAEASDLSRTEPASPRRLQQARSAGDVPRSAELAAWLVLLSTLGILSWLAPRLFAALQGLTEAAFVHAAQPFSPIFLDAVQAALWALLPVLVTILIATLVAPMLLSGWVFAPRIIQADLTRANPFRAIARLFSADAWFDGVLALLKLALAAVAVGWVLASGWPDLQSLSSSEVSVSLLVAWVGRGVLTLAAALTLAAVLDAGWRWWRYLQRHAMTRQEVLAEAREAEGSQEMRARMRSRQQQTGQGGTPDHGAGADAMYPLLPQPSPSRDEGAIARPRTVNEVIG